MLKAVEPLSPPNLKVVLGAGCGDAKLVGPPKLKPAELCVLCVVDG